ncbi:MAG: hypothetical protein IKV32_03565 [Muribaculaceae bacterium]|nr:hypothetical protein [Muribaculaceae bacterium]
MGRKLLTAILTAFLLLVLLTQCSNDEVVKEVEIPLDSICVGDIAFRRGEGFASNMVVYHDVDGQYSHVGIVAMSDSGLVVVHAVPGAHPNQPGSDIVRAERLNEFYASWQSRTGAIMRMSLDSTQRELLNRWALEKAQQRVKFDHEYDLGDTTLLYCTELLQLLYGKIGIDLAQGRRTDITFPGLTNKYVMPSDIYKNENLTIIFKY